MKPVIKFRGEVTVWVVAHEELSSSWRVYTGPRTVEALDRELARERRAGRRAHVEIDTRACTGIEMTLAELEALGIIDAAPGFEVRP